MLLQFFQGPATSAQEQDDLLFFVYLELYQVLCLTAEQSCPFSVCCDHVRIEAQPSAHIIWL